MEEVFIPKISMLTQDGGIFSSLNSLSVFTGYVPITVPIFQAVKVKQENRLTTFLRTLRNSVLKYSRQDYDIISTDEDFDTLFSSETHLVLKERKRTLVHFIKKHETALLALREARMNCWKSKAKLQKYELILETRRSSLRYNQNEAKVREAAIEDMELVHNKWMVKHEKDHIAFEKKFLAEISLREKIQKMSNDLELDVVEMLTDTIRTLMNKNRQNLSDTEVNKLATQVYKQTCRTYKFRHASNIPCEKEWIEKPEYVNTRINKQDIKPKIKTPSLEMD
ncbi:uncharacterized protein LOC132713977 isoform X2 [Ruditapes philippinarum]|uniref:uncharacterized protein LOC132713977 isoform X2 n=1 Tax=Ruditapes philippinarum TaxID=129788 RepID=UPI00295BA58C|nr:uncharacterized protein LOC132713977 isoform X2 [Ruditapes philippinarum]